MTIRQFFQSLLTRIVLFGVTLAVLGGAARYYGQSLYLQNDLTEVISAQQIVLANSVANDIDFKIQDRRQFLDRLARSLPHPLLNQPEALQAWLAERHQLHPIFSLGLLVADAHGKIIADYPVIAGRQGTSIAGNPDFILALEGKSGIARPQIGAATGQPVLPMGISLKNADEKVEAVLIGVTALNDPNFLEGILHRRIGETGSFLLISPAHRLFIAAGDPALTLKPTPPAGVNLLHDRAMEGFRGVGLTINAKGIEELSAIASVPSTDWFVVARWPTSEAFAIVERTLNNIIRHSFTAIVIIILFAGFFIRLMLRPLREAAAQADRMTRGETPLAPLPIVRHDEVGQLTSAFNQLLAKLGNSQLELERLAHHDALSGLPNRLLLADRMHHGLARAQRATSRVGILYLDLNGFKPINDELGHDAGDLALIEVSRRLSALIRQSDTLARVGGDEFVLFITDLEESPETGLAHLADKCINAVAMPMALKNEVRTLGVSIGIALGDGSSDPERLLNAADKAMYEAKNTGRSCYRIAGS